MNLAFLACLKWFNAHAALSKDLVTTLTAPNTAVARASVEARVIAPAATATAALRATTAH